MAHSCRNCKWYFTDIDLPHPVCRLHEFHFEGDYSPCSDYDGPENPTSSSDSGGCGCLGFMYIGGAVVLLAVLVYMLWGNLVPSQDKSESNKTNNQSSVSDTVRVEAVVDTEGSPLRLRKGPSTDSKVITSLKEGTVVYVEEEKDGWSKVTVKNTKETGWCSSQYLKKKK